MTVWLGEGYDGMDRILSRSVKGSRSEVIALLQQLVAHDLGPDEIISASVPDGESHGLLDPHLDKGQITVGTNPHYTARRQTR